MATLSLTASRPNSHLTSRYPCEAGVSDPGDVRSVRSLSALRPLTIPTSVGEGSHRLAPPGQSASLKTRGLTAGTSRDETLSDGFLDDQAEASIVDAGSAGTDEMVDLRVEPSSAAFSGGVAAPVSIW